MEVKQYLNKVRRLDNITKAKIEQIETLREDMQRITPNYASEPVQSTSDPDKYTNAISKIIELEKEIRDDIADLVDLKMDITREINQVEEDLHREILILRYLNANTWEQVAEKMGYDLRWVYRLHGRSLKEFEKVHSRVN